MAEELGAIKWRIDVDTTDLGRAEADMDAAGVQFERSGRRVVSSSKDIQKGIDRTAESAKLAARAVNALAASLAIREAVRYADSWSQVNNQLRQVTASESQLRATRAQLLGIARDTNSELGNTVNLYSELYRATLDLGTSQETVASVTKTINNLFKAGGKDAAETAGAVRQLAQGLASGALRGDEFNSVAEGAPRILDALAQHLGMARGELREFAAEGGITAQIMVDALASYEAEAQRLADLTDETFGQKLVNARTNVTEFVGDLESASGAVGIVGDGIEAFSDNLETAATVATALAAIVAGRLVSAGVAAGGAFLYATTQSMAYQAALARMAGVSATAAAAQSGLAASLALVGGPVGALVLVTGGLALMISKMETAQESTARLREEMDSLNREQLEHGIMLQQTYIRGLELKIDRLKASGTHYAAAQERLKELNEELEAATKELDELQLGMRGVEEREFQKMLDEYFPPLKNFAKGATAATEAVNDLWTGIKRFTEEEQKSITAIAAQRAQLAMSGREAAIFSAVWDAHNSGAGPEAIRIIAETAGALYDQEIAAEAAAQASADASAEVKRTAAAAAAAQKRSLEQVANAQRDAARRAEDDWRAFRESFSNAAADMAMTNGDLVQAIEDSWERLSYKIMADLAASGFLSLLKSSSSGSSIFGGGFSSSAGGMGGLFGSAGTAGNIFDMLGGNEYLARVAGGGQGLTAEAYVEMMQGKRSPTGALNMADLANIGKSIGAGIAGSWAGTKVGESLFGKEAESSWGATIGGMTGAIWGPLGSFIGSALGGMVDAAFGGDGKKRQNAGFLAAPTPGLKDEYNAGTHTFASGLKVTLFARRTDPSAAREITDVFDQVDASFVDLVKALGGEIDMTGKGLRGLDEEATPGSHGTLFGTGGNGTMQGDILAQVNSYIDQLADNVTGLDDALIASVRSSATAEEALALLTQAVVDKAAEDEKERIAAERSAEVLRERTQLQERYDSLTMTSAELLRKQRNALDESNRALFDNIQSLEALSDLTRAEASLASAQAGVRNALRAVGDEVRALADEADSAAAEVASAQQRINNLNREAAAQLRAFGKTIDDFLVSLSPASYGMGLSGLKQQLEATSALAMQGDLNAQAKLVSQAQMVLRAAEENSSSRSDFLRTESFVRNTLVAVRDTLAPPDDDGSQTPLQAAEQELADAQATHAAAQAAYDNALALTSGLVLTQAGALGDLMSALAGLGAANADQYAAQQALTAAQEAAGVVVTDTAGAFRLTSSEAYTLAAVLGLTGDAANTLTASLTDPTKAIGAFSEALSQMTPEQIRAFLGEISPEQIASFMGTINDEQISTFLGMITPAQAASFLGQLQPEQITEFMGSITPEQISTFLGEVKPEQVAAFLGTLSQDQANAFMNTQITGMFAGANSVLIAGINQMLGAAADRAGYTDYSSRDIKQYVKDNNLTTVAEMYAHAVAKNANPYDVGAAYGLTEAETLLRLREAGIPGYEVGSNYIDQDQLAFLHEGEEVKPRRYVDLEQAERSEMNSLLRDIKSGILESARESKHAAKMSEETNNLLLQVINGTLYLNVSVAA